MTALNKPIHYGDVYYLPIYDRNNLITNKTLVIKLFNKK